MFVKTISPRNFEITDDPETILHIENLDSCLGFAIITERERRGLAHVYHSGLQESSDFGEARDTMLGLLKEFSGERIKIFVACLPFRYGGKEEGYTHPLFDYTDSFITQQGLLLPSTQKHTSREMTEGAEGESEILHLKELVVTPDRVKVIGVRGNGARIMPPYEMPYQEMQSSNYNPQQKQQTPWKKPSHQRDCQRFFQGRKTFV